MTTRLCALAAVGASLALTACGTTAPATTPTGSAPSSAATATASTSSVAGSPSSAAVSSAGAVPGAAPATETNPPGDIPDTTAFVDFTPVGSRVVVKVPEGWARSSTSSGAVFADKLNQIRIRVTATSAAPSVASVTTTDVVALRASVAKLANPQVSQTTRTAGPAVLLAYEGDSAQDPVTGKVVRDAVQQYVFYRAGTRVDLTLSGPTNADNVDPWNTVSNSLRWLP